MKAQAIGLPSVLCLLLLWAVSCKKTTDPVVPKSSAKAVSTFAFSGLSPTVTATVDAVAKTVMATVPFGTDIVKLVPTITVSDKATVSPASGVAQDFSKTVNYTVTAEDGTTAVYAVSVGIGAAPKSGAKEMLTFSFNGLSPVVNAIIDGATKTILATLPAGTNVTKLVPTFTVSPKANASPASGATQDFSKAVPYTVTAEDGSTQTYSVTVTAPPAPVATTKTLDCNTIPDVLEDLGDGVDYLVTCMITIRDTRVITIKPGVKIQFDGGNAGINLVGQGALKMIGTAQKPIILEGKIATPGSWKGIYLGANNLENQWEYVTVRHAGSTVDQRAGLKLDGYNSERISLKNCTFSDNTGYGIEVSSFLIGNSKFTGFSKNIFANNSKSALRINYLQWGSLDEGSDYANNGQKYIEVFYQGRDLMDGPATIAKLNVPYRVMQIVYPNESLTFTKGTEIQFTSDAGITVSEYTKNVALIANGTAADPIRFVGYLPNVKGLWAGINPQSVSPETKFNYCVIDGAGSTNFSCVPNTSKAAIMLGRELNCPSIVSRGIITNCTITNSGGYGIAYRNGDPITISDNAFSGNSKADIYQMK